jgi:hypothetical protein
MNVLFGEIDAFEGPLRLRERIFADRSNALRYEFAVVMACPRAGEVGHLGPARYRYFSASAASANLGP